MASSGCILLFAATATVVSSASVLDFLSWGLEYAGEAKSDPSEGQPLRQCSCQGPSCRCCVNFNMTYVDLGGPGCATMSYISQGDGVQVNVSYGTGQLSSELVKAAPDPAPTCVDLVYDLAQICTKFQSLEHTDTGLRGCASLQPTLLGDTQADYPLGCFTMAPDLMALDPTMQPGNLTVSSGVEEPAQNETAGELSEEVIAAFNESAEEGISWFSQLLGLSFGRDNSTQTPPPNQQQQQEQQQQPTTQQPHIVVAQSASEQAAPL